jgi:Glyoxalase-like domain
MSATIDHLVYAGPELDSAVARITALTGVRAAAGGQHPGLGTRNALLCIAERTYLEIIAPDPAQPKPLGPLPFGLADLSAPALRSWAVAPADLDEAVRASRAAGFDYGPIVTGRRRTADGHELTWRASSYPHSSAVTAEPFLIDWGGGPHPASAAPAGLTLEELRLSSPDPRRLHEQLRVLGLDLRVEYADRPGLGAVLSGPQGRITLVS